MLGGLAIASSTASICVQLHANEPRVSRGSHLLWLEVQRDLVLRFLVEARQLVEELAQAVVNRDWQVVGDGLVDGNLLQDAVHHLALGEVDQVLRRLEKVRVAVLDEGQVREIDANVGNERRSGSRECRAVALP